MYMHGETTCIECVRFLQGRTSEIMFHSLYGGDGSAADGRLVGRTLKHRRSKDHNTKTPNISDMSCRVLVRFASVRSGFRCRDPLLPRCSLGRAVQKPLWGLTTPSLRTGKRRRVRFLQHLLDAGTPDERRHHRKRHKPLVEHGRRRRGPEDAAGRDQRVHAIPKGMQVCPCHLSGFRSRCIPY